MFHTMAGYRMRKISPRHRVAHIGTRAALFIGFSRAIDLFGGYAEPHPYVRYRTPAEADGDALAGDWQELGADYADAMAEASVKP